MGREVVRVWGLEAVLVLVLRNGPEGRDDLVEAGQVMVVLIAGDDALVDLGERVLSAVVGALSGVLLVKGLGVLRRTGDAAKLGFGVLDALEFASKDALVPAEAGGVKGAQSIGLGL
jgi:hypothetical protein